MNVTPEKILAKLPPFRNERVLIKEDQRVHDIIGQILNAHEKYADDYSKFAHLFDGKTVEDICNNIYFFLKDHVQYVEEPEEEQTTALPGAIVSLAKGDCKHYSLFSAGVLDALKRSGKKIKWNYRFASYKPLEKTPHHVFVVVNDNGKELWIDPTPGAEKITPVWQLDKKVQTKNLDMPLYDVVGNIGGTSIGYTRAEKFAHATAKVNPLLVAGRAAFLQMLKWNVRAWAKNIQDLTNKYGREASDPIGKRWYLFGGDSAPFWSAVAEGSTKKMLGNTIGVDPATITALITAAAPIVIALTSMVKSLSRKNDWQDGQLLFPTTGTTLPGGTPTTGTTNFFRSPLFLALAAGGGYLLYTSMNKKKRVNGAMDNTLLLLLLAGGGLWLYKNMQQPTTQPVTDTAEYLQQLPGSDTAVEIEPVQDFANPVDNYGGGGGGFDPEYLKQDYTTEIPFEALM